MPSIWRSKEELQQEGPLPLTASMPALVQRILYARGVSTSKDLDKILSPKMSELQDPLSILGMSKAVERMIEAFEQNQIICIYADFDLDGTSGLALLKYGLEDLGFKNILYYQPKRLSEGYGFHEHAVEELKQKNVDLIITVDVGITAVAACKKAKALGIDVIITDHHQPAEVLPEAFVICNPNQKDCSSHLKYLCGAGVAFYLLRALKRGLVNKNLIPETFLNFKSILDFFAIATLTDMVPLVEDNRILVKAGLQQLEHTQRAGLKALLLELDMYSRPLTSQDVAIRFAPKLNALSRMELGLLPLDIFLMEDEAEAKKAVKNVLKNNQTRVSLQQEGDIEAQIQLNTWPHSKFVALQSPVFHRGVVGLIATKISQLRSAPAFIGSLNIEGQIVGSARAGEEGFENSVLLALESCSDLLMRFGGHHAAAGFELKSENWTAFVERLSLYYEQLNQQEKVREIIYDSDASVEMITENLMKWFDAIGPFGQNFSAPLLRIKNLRVQSKKELNGGHLKMKFVCFHSNKAIDGLWFSPPARIKQDIAENELVEVLAEIQWNYFAGRKSLQVLIKEMRKHHES